jgi:2-C-methyl-D-erythritol 4-phosphate cytidylyltransferase
MKSGAIIVAAGEGRRMRGKEKLFYPLGGSPLLVLTLKAFQRHPGIDAIVLVGGERVRKEFGEKWKEGYGFSKVIAAVAGGPLRQDSVYNGLRAFPSPPDLVLIHDGDRPFIPRSVISAVLKEAALGGALAAVAVKDTVKRVDGEGVIVDTPNRRELRLAQTPQGFPFPLILAAHERARREGWEVTDDASLAERAGVRVRVVEGSYDNIKVTTPEDLALAELIHSRRQKKN